MNMTDTEGIMVMTVNKRYRVFKLTTGLSKYNVGDLMELDRWYLVQAKSNKHIVLKVID